MYYQASDVPQMTEKCHILYITPTIKVKQLTTGFLHIFHFKIIIIIFSFIFGI